uniref:Stress regulated protein isoform 2 n=1 Tax=Solanum melongena TaxID=223891 RepID=Q2KP23_SOLME|nr:stress regulated protein isoform 2 [Solanum virginianum]AAW65811.1 stress regulated protein isoform 2 [Solanum virginianum]
MGSIAAYCGGLLCCSQLRSSNSRILSGLSVLEQVDKELMKGDERAALSLVKDLRGKPGGLRCFGAARQVPQRLYSLDELRLNGIETVSLLSPVDATLGAIERNLQIVAILSGSAAWYALDLSPQQILFVSLGVLFLWTLDLVNSGKVTATMLNRFSCIALAGVATEYLLFGYAEGGLSDINQLDALLKSLGFTQKKADSQVRWAVLNTILILRRHEKARVKLAEAMTRGKSVGVCIDIIEKSISEDDL